MWEPTMPPARPPRSPVVGDKDCDLHARDMTAAFAADMTLGEAQRRLRELNQWLPVDGDADAPLGRLIEINSTGPLRLGYGAWRDLLLGVQYTDGRGALISAGGRTVKNVAGYDLTKFMVGSRGAFGRIRTLTTRTYRRPSGAIIVRFPPRSGRLAELLPTPLRPHWSLLDGDALWCGYHVDGPAAEGFFQAELARTAAAEAAVCSLDDDIAHRAVRWRTADPAAVRISLPPARLDGFIHRAGPMRWVADPAFGIVLAFAESTEQAQAIRAAAGEAGGSAGGSTSPSERRIIERLKQTLDPTMALSPLPWGAE